MIRSLSARYNVTDGELIFCELRLLFLTTSQACAIYGISESWRFVVEPWLDLAHVGSARNLPSSIRLIADHPKIDTSSLGEKCARDEFRETQLEISTMTGQFDISASTDPAFINIAVRVRQSGDHNNFPREGDLASIRPARVPLAAFCGTSR
jgi:hypothetical protein